MIYTYNKFIFVKYNHVLYSFLINKMMQVLHNIIIIAKITILSDKMSYKLNFNWHQVELTFRTMHIERTSDRRISLHRIDNCFAISAAFRRDPVTYSPNDNYTRSRLDHAFRANKSRSGHVELNGFLCAAGDAVRAVFVPEFGPVNVFNGGMCFVWDSLCQIMTVD